MTVDIGVSYEDAEREAAFIVDAGTYRCLVESMEKKDSAKGRPMFVYTITIDDPEFPEASGKKMNYFCPLAWTNPDTNERDTKGIGRLVDLAKAVDCEWEGTDFDETEPVGRHLLAKVEEGEWEGSPKNDIKRVLRLSE